MLLPLRLEMGPRCSNHLGLFVDAPLSRPDFPIARELISMQQRDAARSFEVVGPGIDRRCRAFRG